VRLSSGKEAALFSPRNEGGIMMRKKIEELGLSHEETETLLMMLEQKKTTLAAYLRMLIRENMRVRFILRGERQ